MRLTDDIVRALHGCINDCFDSVEDFARFTNVSANTVSKYLRKEQANIHKETWEKIYPLIRNYLPHKSGGGGGHGYELDADQKILIDAFSALPADVKNQKLLEIVELAAKAVAQEKKTNG